MAYENLTTFTEVDPNNKWEQTTIRNTFTALPYYDGSYVYKSYGAGYFGNYEIYFDMYISSASLVDVRAGVWCVTNAPSYVGNLYSGQLIRVNTASTTFRFEAIESGNYDSSSTGYNYDFDTTYYLVVTRVGTSFICKIYLSSSDRTNGVNVLDTLSLTAESSTYEYMEIGLAWSSGGGGDTIDGYIENFDINPTGIQEVLLTDTIQLSDSINIGGSITLVDTIILSDTLENTLDIDNDFRMVEVIYKDIDNNFISCQGKVISDSNNIFISSIPILSDTNNDFRSKKLKLNNLNNDFRMLSAWQMPPAGQTGIQSAGKEEVKVYISSVEQIDINIDSISITQILNGASTASFDLGRPYDNTKPTIKSVVEIKYKDILLFKGYITDIRPADNPESIRIDCQDEYWNLNLTKKYFFVGRKPIDAKEYYYENIKLALAGIGFNYDIGDFIPITIDEYGKGHADTISDLVVNAGNFAWFIAPNGTKRIWEAGVGGIINLQRQEIGKNLSLYQILRHNFNESISNLINRLKVQMGNKVIRKEKDGKNFLEYRYVTTYHTYAIPAWDSNLEKLAVNNGYGFDYQDPSKKYSDVFRKFYLPFLDPGKASWSDRKPPLIFTRSNLGIFHSQWDSDVRRVTEGYTIDYKAEMQESGLGLTIRRPTITFSEPQYLYQANEYGDMKAIRSKNIEVYLYKENIYRFTLNDQVSPDDEPDKTPLMFFTNKMGSYYETITEDLNLSNLSIQEGFVYNDIDPDTGEQILITVPSWDDTEFAKEFANWQLSKSADIKITGSVDLTIDAILFYGIDLSKRIQINNVIDTPINIKSITYNFNNFQATLQLENGRFFKRAVSIPYRGE